MGYHPLKRRPQSRHRMEEQLARLPAVTSHRRRRRAVVVGRCSPSARTRTRRPRSSTTIPVQSPGRPEEGAAHPRRAGGGPLHPDRGRTRRTSRRHGSSSGPEPRGGLTREEWITGNNPVVPYPIDDSRSRPTRSTSRSPTARCSRWRCFRRRARTSRANLLSRPETSREGRNARWLVDNWVPRGSALTAALSPAPDRLRNRPRAP